MEDGRLVQHHTGAPADENTGDAIYFGDAGWTDYTLSVDAEILSGAEGFLIPVCVADPENTVFWNLGGWGNTVSCLQTVTGGAKSGQVNGTVSNLRLNRGRTYHLEVQVSGDTVICRMDGRAVIRWTKREAGGLFANAGTTDQGDLILRVVNAADEPKDLDLALSGFDPAVWDTEAAVLTLAGDKPTIANSFLAPEAVVPEAAVMTIGADCICEIPAWSLTVIRIPARH